MKKEGSKPLLGMVGIFIRPTLEDQAVDITFYMHLSRA